MHFIVIIPIGLLILLAIGVFALLSAALEALGAFAVGLVAFLAALVAFIAGPVLLLVGSYRFIRCVGLKLWRTNYTFPYLLWIGIGLCVSAFGCACFINKEQNLWTEHVRVVTQETVYLFFTTDHVEFHEVPNFWSQVLHIGLWVCAIGIVTTAIEAMLKNPKRVRAVAQSAAEAVADSASRLKSKLDGPTARPPGSS
jgi:hypothetical protein